MITGYSPRRHRQGTDVMLLKKEHDYDVERLRTIVLFDSEANINYKHLGRRAMAAAIDNNFIATEQYSRPNQKSIDHAINRRLVIDHQLYKRQPYAITSCDLKSCYDRINHTSASLALQRVGIAKEEVLSMFRSIQSMTHRARTAFGDSVLTYGDTSRESSWKLPPQGVLQGNGSGPAIWSILSSCIFQLLRQNGHCNSIKSSIRKLLLDLSGFAYVDDTDLLQVNNTVEEVVHYMQRKLTEWNQAVGITGGILSPSKCWWYLITFKYIAGRWKAVAPQRDFQLWLKNE
jgi:Reverse transcriptase (RNA-dependent DNA polymerase).